LCFKHWGLKRLGIKYLVLKHWGLKRLGLVKGKVVVISGASSGIGKALAARYAQAGAHLAICARSLERLEPVADVLRSRYSVDVLAQRCDVSDQAQCGEFIAQTLESLGRIDVLINNAGISMRAPFQDVNLAVLHQVMDINYWGSVYLTKAALPAVMQQKGSLVGVSSIAGFVGLPERVGYSSSKFALHGFLEALRIELLKQGTHVLLACPGFTESNIRNTALLADGHPQGKSPREEKGLMTAEAVAEAIFRAQQRRKRTLVLTGKGKWTVRLRKLFPAWMDTLVWREFEKERQHEAQRNR